MPDSRPTGRGSRLAWGFALLLFAGFASLDRLAAGATVPQLRTVADILQMDRKLAEQGQPVSILLSVTYYDPQSLLLFGHDGQAGVYIHYTGPALSLKGGDRIQVDGVTGPGRFSPVILAKTVQLVGPGPLPEARAMSYSRFHAGAEDAQWVQLSGEVRGAHREGDNLLFDVIVGDDRVTVYVLGGGGLDAAVADGALLNLKGVVVGRHGESARGVLGFMLMVPGPTLVERVLTGNLAEADDLEVGNLASARGYRFVKPGSGAPRLRVRGTVTACRPGSWVAFEDGTDAAIAWTTQTNRFEPGDQVVVRGFISLSHVRLEFQDALLRRVTGGVEPTAKPASSQALADMDFCGHLIQLTGELRQIDLSNETQAKLMMEIGGRVAVALLPKGEPGAPERIQNLRLGDTLKLSGVLDLRMTDEDLARGGRLPRIWLRRPSDVAWISSAEPGLLPVRIVLWLCFGLLLGAVAVILLLRSRTTKSLLLTGRGGVALARVDSNQLLEGLGDIVFRFDSAARLAGISASGLRLLGQTPESVVGQPLTRIISPRHWDKLSGILSAPAVDIPVVQELEVAGANSESLLLLVRFVRFIDPASGEPMVLAIGQNITDRRHMEAELAESEHQLRAALETRDRIARDLHDNIIQSLYALGLGMEEVRTTLGMDLPGKTDPLGRLVTDLNRVLKDVRSFLGGLRTSEPVAHDLERILQGLVLQLSRVDGTRFILDIDALAARDLDGEQVIQITHVAREAMSNASKHSKAAAAVVSLRKHRSQIRFEVRDDGLGFEPSGAPLRGHGLRNIVTRAQELGAQLEIKSSPGRGTCVTLVLNPNHANADEHTDREQDGPNPVGG